MSHTNDEEKWCRCLVHTTHKGVNNPYAVCTSRIHPNTGHSIKCTEITDYNHPHLSKEELLTYARSKNLCVNNSMSKSEIANILNYKTPCVQYINHYP